MWWRWRRGVLSRGELGDSVVVVVVGAGGCRRALALLQVLGPGGFATEGLVGTGGVVDGRMGEWAGGVCILARAH